MKHIEVFSIPEAVSKAAAAFIIGLAFESVATKGKFVIALSGGNTPGQLFSLLASTEYHDKIPWANTYIFWGDERCVPLDDPANNAHVASLLLLNKVPVPQSNIFPIPVSLPPADAALAYEKTIKDFFGEEEPCFDLILLGLGENGHTASLFPGTDVLQEQVRLVKEVYVEELKMFRITMTAHLINLAHNILFLVTGKGKAAVLQNVLYGQYLPSTYPAQLIEPLHGELYWFVDGNADNSIL